MNNNIIDESMTFTVTNDQGVEVKCEVLVDFLDEDSGRTFIAYTDYIYDEEGKFTIYSSEIVQEENEFRLLSIEDEEINKKIQEFIDEVRSEPIPKSD